MIQIIAENIPLHPYITSYSISVSPVYSGSKFTRYDGKDISEIMGQKTIIQCTLEKVPHSAAQDIASIVNKSSFELTYTSPISITEQFKCTKYNAVPKSTDPRQKNPLITDNITWTLSMTLESADIGGGGL
ncbi:MAG: hypothetical protein ACI4JF_07430 [Oscillospiraceae bacterium]